MLKSSERTVEEIDSEIERIKNELNDVHGTETEVYARIVGYYRAVNNWNKGKRDEFDSRKAFEIETALNGTKKCPDEKVSFSTENALSENKELSSEENSGSVYYELYAKQTCPNCPPVKNYMKNIPLKGNYIDVDTDSGLSEAASQGVFASPTVIVYDSESNEIARGHNVEELEEIFSKILVKESV